MKILPLIFPYLLAQLEEINNKTTETEIEEENEDVALENNETIVEEVELFQEVLQDNSTSIDFVDVNSTESEIFEDLDSNETETTTEEPTTTTTSTTTTTTTTTTIKFGECVEKFNDEGNHICLTEVKGRNGEFVVVSCEYKELTSIPCGISQNVTRLNLESNRIAEIYSGQLQNLPKIGEIQFGNQALNSIGKETFKDIPSLTKLSFQSTHVGELRPDTFLGLENLVSIDFRSSKLQTIHEGAFAGLFNLEQIALTANGINELPEIMFEDSSNLKILLMDSNKIESFENTTFSGLFQLERLELQNNNLKFLPEFGFKDFEKVTKLKLSNNKLHQISENDLIGLESLEDLTINDNELNFVHENAFASLKKLKFLEMNNNKIQVIEPNWFLNIIPRSTQAAQFGLNDNIWNCGCNSTRFRLWYELDENKDLFTTLTKIEHMNCSSPEYMKNFTINGLDLTWFPKSEDDPCEPPPRIWGHPNLSIKRKSEAQLICGIKEGKPQPKYFWKRPDNSTVWTNTSTLTIEAISDADRGVYECKALNIAGESIEKHSVEVTWEDAITDELGNYIGIRGTNSAQSQFLCSFFFYLFIILFFH